mmetsp:Transcript_12493/g.30689  ORF Transcript_12493/g.30689 Transcript_12493/m.30689 type:complete len:214 (-) Transcript_12493:111-752(-)
MGSQGSTSLVGHTCAPNCCGWRYTVGQPAARAATHDTGPAQGAYARYASRLSTDWSFRRASMDTGASDSHSCASARDVFVARNTYTPVLSRPMRVTGDSGLSGSDSSSMFSFMNTASVLYFSSSRLKERYASRRYTTSTSLMWQWYPSASTSARITCLLHPMASHLVLPMVACCALAALPPVPPAPALVLAAALAAALCAAASLMRATMSAWL